MFEKRLIAVTATILMMLTDTNVYAAYKNGDFQIWNTDYQECNIVKNFKYILEEEFHWVNDVNKFYYQHYDLGLFFDANKHINIGGGYRQIYEFFSSGDPKLTRFNNKFAPDYCPYMTGKISGELAGFKIDDANRLEFNNLDHKADFWRYRNKLTIKTPWKFTKLGLQPYVSDEVFVVFAGVPSDINQNRLACGVTMNLTKQINFDISYMSQQVKLSVKNPGKWLGSNVLWFKLRMAF